MEKPDRFHHKSGDSGWNLRFLLSFGNAYISFWRLWFITVRKQEFTVCSNSVLVLYTVTFVNISFFCFDKLFLISICYIGGFLVLDDFLFKWRIQGFSKFSFQPFADCFGKLSLKESGFITFDDINLEKNNQFEEWDRQIKAWKDMIEQRIEEYVNGKDGNLIPRANPTGKNCQYILVMIA